MRGEIGTGHRNAIILILGVLLLAIVLLAFPQLTKAACQNVRAQRISQFLLLGTSPESPLDKVVCTFPDREIELGVITLLANGEVEQARTDVRNLLILNPHYRRTRFWAARLVELAHSPVSDSIAETAFDLAVQIEPNDPGFWYERGDFIKGQQPDKAVASYQRGIDIDPDNAADGYLRLATLYYQTQRQAQALEAFQQAEQNDNLHHHLLKAQQALLYFYMAEIYAQREQLDDSVVYYERSLDASQAPGWPTYAAYLGIGRLARVHGDASRAEMFYTQALAFANADDQRSAVYKEMGQWHADVGDREQAVRDYEQAYELNPNDEWNYLAAAQLQEKMNQIPQAIANYQKALSINPKLVVAQDSLQRLQHKDESNP